MRLLTFFCSLFFVFLSNQAHALIAPQYAYANLVKATLGVDPCVVVGDLSETGDGHYNLRLDVCNAEKAQALNALLNHSSSALVINEVFGPDHKPLTTTPPCIISSPKQVAELFTNALTGNRFMANGFVASQGPDAPIWIEVKAVVVQYWADNLLDRYGNVNYVAAAAFKELLAFPACGEGPQVGFTTERL